MSNHRHDVSKGCRGALKISDEILRYLCKREKPLGCAACLTSCAQYIRREIRVTSSVLHLTFSLSHLGEEHTVFVLHFILKNIKDVELRPEFLNMSFRLILTLTPSLSVFIGPSDLSSGSLCSASGLLQSIYSWMSFKRRERLDNFQQILFNFPVSQVPAHVLHKMLRHGKNAPGVSVNQRKFDSSLYFYCIEKKYKELLKTCKCETTNAEDEAVVPRYELEYNSASKVSIRGSRVERSQQDTNIPDGSIRIVETSKILDPTDSDDTAIIPMEEDKSSDSATHPTRSQPEDNIVTTPATPPKTPTEVLGDHITSADDDVKILEAFPPNTTTGLNSSFDAKLPPQNYDGMDYLSITNLLRTRFRKMTRYSHKRRSQNYLRQHRLSKQSIIREGSEMKEIEILNVFPISTSEEIVVDLTEDDITVPDLGDEASISNKVSSPKIFFVAGKMNQKKLCSLDLKTYDIEMVAEFPFQGSYVKLLYHHGRIFAFCTDTSSSSNRDKMTSVQHFDPGSQVWFRGPQLKEPRSLFSVAAVDDNIYVIGGHNGRTTTDTVESWRFSDFSADDSWIVASGSCPPVVGHGVASVGKNIYLVGGISNLALTDSLHMYEPAKGQWEANRASMTTRRACLCTAVLGTRLYAIGGGSGKSGSELTLCEVYDTEKDAWTTLAPLNQARQNACSFTHNGDIYVIGGNDPGALPTLEKYNARTDSWTLIVDCTLPLDGYYRSVAFAT